MTFKGTKMYLSFGLNAIYEDAEFIINDNDKVGIVGVNGAGKTTLFKILLKELELDSGNVYIGNARIGYLPQEIVLNDESITVWDFLQDGRPIRKLETELNEIYKQLESEDVEGMSNLLKDMAHIQSKLEYYDYFNAENVLLEIVENMKIDADLLDMRLRDLSGGQKSKMAFARVLYSKPEILLLDEPTNHLDAITKDFVISYLKKYKGCVLIISHEVDFLNQIVNKIIHINKISHKITVYDGDYFTYQKKYADEQRLRELVIKKQEKEIKELADFVQKAKQASQTNHALKAMGLERALRLEKKRGELIKRVKKYRRVRVDIYPKREGALIPLEVENLTFGYEKQPFLYKDLSFIINSKERFLIVGENGIGKSTLLKLITGILVPKQGRIRFNPKTDIAYYAQELEQLDLDKTVIQNVETEGYTEWQLRGALSNFLFYDEDINKRVKVLSPGEKARIALCKILLQKANLLILDEPTNHLDPETQEVIGENFKEYEGTIIVVSHNPDFVETIGISRMLILPYGKIVEYSHELLEYFYQLNTKPEE